MFDRQIAKVALGGGCSHLEEFFSRFPCIEKGRLFGTSSVDVIKIETGCPIIRRQFRFCVRSFQGRRIVGQIVAELSDEISVSDPRSKGAFALDCVAHGLT